MEMLRIFEASMFVKGTNCANCKYGDTDRSKPLAKEEQNGQGGLDPTGKDLTLAEKGDLITLPGKSTATKKFPCTHSEIKQDVTERMCCAYWDADGSIRAWK